MLAHATSRPVPSRSLTRASPGGRRAARARRPFRRRGRPPRRPARRRRGARAPAGLPSERQAEPLELQDCVDRAGHRLELERLDVWPSELLRVEIGPERVEEDGGAVPPEEGEGRLVGAFVRALAVVAALLGEGGRDLLARSFDSAFTERAVE